MIDYRDVLDKLGVYNLGWRISPAFMLWAFNRDNSLVYCQQCGAKVDGYYDHAPYTETGIYPVQVYPCGCEVRVHWYATTEEWNESVRARAKR